jgi:acetyl-CoA carboxylase biotin carboxylase subunit
LFERILVANRGEIAVRIMRTCREMGIETVAVFTAADREALHVGMADRTVAIGAPGRYMDAAAIIAAARESGADAVHPGYGFLAENPTFARMCTANGLTFIGPRGSTIELMGHKTLAREAVRRAGVPVVPGSAGALRDRADGLGQARRIGFPVMIKAVAGGGGRGMRPAAGEDEFARAFEQAALEAGSTCGNPEIYLEKYMHNFRHIEIQVVADEHGNAVYLGERDCSIQRRNQKLIEEAPSPYVSPSLRRAMGQAALQVVRAVNYTNVGTIEFIVDSDGRFYFMEMNTRIQVEHAVTELVTGMDLVREQIRLAAGLELEARQKDVEITGWAVECRINAENPQTFLPCPGRVQVYHPPGGFCVRVDSALYPGCVVPPYYDPLVAKLLVWGKNRGEALERMSRALAEFRIEGIHTTIPLHLRLLADPRFRAGEYQTDFVHRFLAENVPPPADPVLAAVIGASITAYLEREHQPLRVVHPYRPSLWRADALRESMRRYV